MTAIVRFALTLLLTLSALLQVPASGQVVLESGEFALTYDPAIEAWLSNPLEQAPRGEEWGDVFTIPGLDEMMSNGESVSEGFRTRWDGYNCCLWGMGRSFGVSANPVIGPIEIDDAALQAQLDANVAAIGGLSVELIETTVAGVETIVYAEGPETFSIEVFDFGSGIVLGFGWTGWDRDDSFIELDSTYRLRISWAGCAQGTVNAGNGFVSNVLFLGGSAGGADRTVEISEGDLVDVTLLRPIAGGSGKFALHANLGTPLGGTLTSLPFEIGATCFPMLTSDGAAPVLVANNIGKTNQLGASHYQGVPTPDPDPATTSFLYPDLPLGTVLTFQGVVVDPASQGLRAVSATNAVVLRVR